MVAPVGLRLPLLLEHRVQLRAGQRDRLHDVRERLHRERLGVGHHAVALAGRAGRVVQVGADAAGVGDGDLRAVARVVAASWASAMTSPSGSSPDGRRGRVRSAVIVPTWPVADRRGLGDGLGRPGPGRPGPG